MMMIQASKVTPNVKSSLPIVKPRSTVMGRSWITNAPVPVRQATLPKPVAIPLKTARRIMTDANPITCSQSNPMMSSSSSKPILSKSLGAEPNMNAIIAVKKHEYLKKKVVVPTKQELTIFKTETNVQTKKEDVKVNVKPVVVDKPPYIREIKTTYLKKEVSMLNTAAKSLEALPLDSKPVDLNVKRIESNNKADIKKPMACKSEQVMEKKLVVSMIGNDKKDGEVKLLKELPTVIKLKLDRKAHKNKNGKKDNKTTVKRDEERVEKVALAPPRRELKGISNHDYMELLLQKHQLLQEQTERAQKIIIQNNKRLDWEARRKIMEKMDRIVKDIVLERKAKAKECEALYTGSDLLYINSSFAMPPSPFWIQIKELTKTNQKLPCGFFMNAEPLHSPNIYKF